MRILFACFLLCYSFNTQGQIIQLKSEINQKAKAKITIRNNDLEAKLNATPKQIELQLKNLSDAYIIVTEDDFELIHHTGIKTQLCGQTLKIGPKEKERIILKNCSEKSKIGLFGLKSHYDSNEEFEEASLFLNDKSFKLRLGEQWFSFYTAY